MTNSRSLNQVLCGLNCPVSQGNVTIINLPLKGYVVSSPLGQRSFFRNDRMKHYVSQHLGLSLEMGWIQQ